MGEADVIFDCDYIGILNDDLTIEQFEEWIDGADMYCYTQGTGRLVGHTASSVTYSLGTPALGNTPLVITAPTGNTFGAAVVDYTVDLIALNFPSLCYWDITHMSGSDPADLDLIYLKANVPDRHGDLTTVSYVFHREGTTAWKNATEGGAVTVDNWDGDTDYYKSTAYGMMAFSPYAPSSTLGIPTMTEWALIILGSLLAIVGGWYVWRRFS